MLSDGNKHTYPKSGFYIYKYYVLSLLNRLSIQGKKISIFAQDGIMLKNNKFKLINFGFFFSPLALENILSLLNIIHILPLICS